MLIFFIQLANVLPIKSVPQTGCQSKKRKHRAVQVVMEEVEDQDSPQRLSARSQSPLDPNIILEEAPIAVSHSSSSKLMTGNGNKKTTKVNIFWNLLVYLQYTDRLLWLVCDKESDLLFLQAYWI